MWRPSKALPAESLKYTSLCLPSACEVMPPVPCTRIGRCVHEYEDLVHNLGIYVQHRLWFALVGFVSRLLPGQRQAGLGLCLVGDGLEGYLVSLFRQLASDRVCPRLGSSASAFQSRLR